MNAKNSPDQTGPDRSGPQTGPSQTGPTGEGRKVSGLFDIRNIIGALLFIYGVVLFIAGIIGDSESSSNKDAGLNANLWVGIALLLVGGFFLGWARLRPVVVPAQEPDAEPADRK